MDNEILALEKKYWSAMQDHDFNTVKSLTRFPCIIAGKQGAQCIDEPAFKKMFESGEGKKMKVIDIRDEQIQVINDSAYIAYIIESEYNIEGKKKSAVCACASAWVKENNNWLCSLHTKTDVEDRQ